MGLSKKRILIVDDDEFIRDYLSVILEKAGYEVAVAQGGRIAQCLVEEQHFEAVVTDMSMPEGSGTELVCFIRARSLSMPIVLMTASLSEEIARQALELGADDILPKPFLGERLLATLSGRFGSIEGD